MRTWQLSSEESLPFFGLASFLYKNSHIRLTPKSLSGHLEAHDFFPEDSFRLTEKFLAII